jgi:polyisoprenoid-binding protein YceI
MGRLRPHGTILALPIAATLWFLAAGPVRAEPQVYSIDATRSWAEFQVHYLGFIRSSGRFGSVAGAVRFDPTDWDHLSVTVKIQVDSLAARPEFWRHQLLSVHFFDVAHFPTIDFSGDGAHRTGPERGDAWGQLTLHGITHPVVLAATVNWHLHEVEFDATSSLQRSAFGLGGFLPLASDSVTVVLHLHAVR